ncbi:MAG: amidohydrolase family protein [Rhodospirillaceae bacterium]
MTYKISRLSIAFALSLIAFAENAAAQSVLIQNVTLIDGTGAPPVSGASVLVQDGRFAEISTLPIIPPAGTNVVEGTGKFLMPGIIDSHIHLPGGRTGPGNRTMKIDMPTALKSMDAYLYSGVTAIYDSGNNAEFIFKMRDDERAGRIRGPRIYATISLIAPPEGHGCCAGGTVVTSYEDGVEKLDALFALKPDLLKFTRERRGMGPVGRNIPLFETDLMNKLVAYAHEKGMRTTVHVSEVAMAREAVDAGTDAFAHIVYLDDANKDFAKLVADKGIILSTTMTRIEPDTSFFDEPLYVATLSQEMRDEIRSSDRFNGSPYTGWLSSLRPAIMKNVKALHEAGAILAMGTDRSMGPMPHQELKSIVAAGISPLEAIRMGTLNAAMYIGVEDDIGSIEPGKLADMLLLDADPTADINNTTMIDSVYKGGVWIDRSTLDVPANAATLR